MATEFFKWKMLHEHVLKIHDTKVLLNILFACISAKAIFVDQQLYYQSPI